MSEPTSQNSGQGRPAPWRAALANTRQRSLAFLWFLFKTILPLYLLTEVLKQSGALAWLAGFLAPFMGVWGLPGEAAAVLTAGMLVNLYAATAVAAPLGLTWQQVSVLGLILGIAHSLVVEAAVVRQLTPRHHRLTLLRLGLGLAAGWVLKLIIM
ncbi:MAG: nucleoside recognition domain-containing protein [Pseudomonadota bacterium]